MERCRKQTGANPPISPSRVTAQGPPPGGGSGSARVCEGQKGPSRGARASRCAGQRVPRGFQRGPSRRCARARRSRSAAVQPRGRMSARARLRAGRRVSQARLGATRRALRGRSPQRPGWWDGTKSNQIKPRAPGAGACRARSIHPAPSAPPGAPPQPVSPRLRRRPSRRPPPRKLTRVNFRSRKAHLPESRGAGTPPAAGRPRPPAGR